MLTSHSASKTITGHHVEATPSRKLAVILHADIVASTTLVQMNET